MRARGKRKSPPRLRASAHLAEIITLAGETKDFLKGHRMKPEFRRQFYRDLRNARITIRQLYQMATGTFR